MKPWINAWLLGTISGVSLPLGAILGILLAPVRDEVCAGWMAIGAGALLFAVTVELYGHALRELELRRAGLLELLATVAGALLGALFYLAVNRWLEENLVESLEENADGGSKDSEQPGQRQASDSESPSEVTPLYPREKKCLERQQRLG